MTYLFYQNMIKLQCLPVNIIGVYHGDAKMDNWLRLNNIEQHMMWETCLIISNLYVDRVVYLKMRVQVLSVLLGFTLASNREQFCNNKFCLKKSVFFYFV